MENDVILSQIPVNPVGKGRAFISPLMPAGMAGIKNRCFLFSPSLA
jgi:hypothetical protein